MTKPHFLHSIVANNCFYTHFLKTESLNTEMSENSVSFVQFFINKFLNGEQKISKVWVVTDQE